MDCSPPGSSVHGILQTRILEWVLISFSRGLPRDQIMSLASPTLTDVFLTTEPPGKPLHSHIFEQTSPRMCEATHRHTPVHKHPDPCLSLPSSETRNMGRSTYSKRGRNELALGTQTRKPCDSGYERMCKPRQALCEHLVFPFMLL